MRNLGEGVVGWGRRALKWATGSPYARARARARANTFSSIVFWCPFLPTTGTPISSTPRLNPAQEVHRVMWTGAHVGCIFPGLNTAQQFYYKPLHIIPSAYSKPSLCSLIWSDCFIFHRENKGSPVSAPSAFLLQSPADWSAFAFSGWSPFSPRLYS